MNFEVDKNKCTQCGLCASDCPVLIINAKTEFPTIKEGKENQCIKCQHCLAICPSEAISIWGKKPENSISVSEPIPSVKDMENLIKTRRSIRKFKNEEIDKSLIHHIISTASYAPTGHNANSVQFTVVDNKTDMRKFRDMAYQGIRKAFKENRIPASKIFLNDFHNLWKTKQIDVIFRNAPHLLIVSAPKKNTTPKTDSCIAMSYFELLANCYGIGTLWNGYAKWVIDEIVPVIKESIGIPDNHLVAATMSFGISAVKYARSIQNNSVNIMEVKF